MMSERMGNDPQLSQHPDVKDLQRQYGAASSGNVVGEGLFVLAGAWLAIAPWVAGFAGASFPMTANNVIIGLVVVALGLRSAGIGGQALSWAGVPLGVWAIVATWLVPHGGGLGAGLVWSNVVGGAVVVLASAAVMSGTMISLSQSGRK